jgi:hypothetical protein
MAPDEDPREERREKSPVNYFSCAFCNANSPKPFRICESCGEAQPEEEEGEEE